MEDPIFEPEIPKSQQASTFAPLAIKLLKGVVYEEEQRHWEDLIKVQELPLRRYFEQIGLLLIVNREDGFAYLRQAQAEEDTDGALPRLMKRRTLSLDQSILCLLLRETLEEHTVSEAANREPILSLRDIRERVELFFRERATQQRFLKDVKKTVEEVRKMEFLEVIGTPSQLNNEDETRYRVKRILKSFIGTDELNQLIAQIQTTIK